MAVRFQRILVPTDFSPESDRALEYGVTLVEKFGASIHVLHVLEAFAGAEPLVWQFENRRVVEEKVEEQAWIEIHNLLSTDEQKRLRATLAVEWGTPFAEIVRYAREKKIDCIAMGTHGRGRVEHLLVGSVTENVVRRAPCPVLTVPSQASKK
jgi:nucleotide-binding universal stress UspA family protein